MLAPGAVNLTSFRNVSGLTTPAGVHETGFAHGAFVTLKLFVAPRHTSNRAGDTAGASTVTGWESDRPSASVTVTVTPPAATAVTTPLPLTAATAGFPLAQA